MTWKPFQSKVSPKVLLALLLLEIKALKLRRVFSSFAQKHNLCPLPTISIAQATEFETPNTQGRSGLLFHGRPLHDLPQFPPPVQSSDCWALKEFIALIWPVHLMFHTWWSVCIIPPPIMLKRCQKYNPPCRVVNKRHEKVMFIKLPAVVNSLSWRPQINKDGLLFRQSSNRETREASHSRWNSCENLKGQQKSRYVRKQKWIQINQIAVAYLCVCFKAT